MRVLVTLVAFAIPWFGACERPIAGRSTSVKTAEEYDMAIGNGILKLAEVREFESLFPGSFHFITHYREGYGPTVWNSKVGLHGRYILTMQFEIVFDESRTFPSRKGTPVFYLHEVDRVERLPDGRSSIRYSENQLHFGPEKWDQLLRKGGDLTSIGFETIVDRPINDFDEIWKNS